MKPEAPLQNSSDAAKSPIFTRLADSDDLEEQVDDL
jgi:hypothetical protein